MAKAVKGPKPSRSGVRPEPQGANPESEGLSKIRVRMYRVGLGDCFLISLLRPADTPFHMMIDCGVILGTQDRQSRLRAAVQDIIAETDGYIDVLAVTHEHFDHVAGFTDVKDLFVSPGVREAGERDKTKLSVGEVWFAWTEDPDDATATSLRKDRHAQANALAAFGGSMGAAADAVPHLMAALSFLGVAHDGKLGVTAQSMANAAGFAPPNGVRYLRPLQTPPIKNAPELRVYVLGPPEDPKMLRKCDASSGLYHLDATSLVESVGLVTIKGDDPSAPFEEAWTCRLDFESDNLSESDRQVMDFIEERYGPKDPVKPSDLNWRRIDGDWLASSSELALALDSATNNTSLVLAIEHIATRQVLLFPGDAQAGNWLSWQSLTWEKDGYAKNVKDLLNRTVFYKVAHHGSENATLKELGLELMTQPGLMAFIPVDHQMAVRKNWGRIPQHQLVEALHRHMGGPPVQTDVLLDPAVTKGVIKGGDGRISGYDSLYYDWSIEIPPLLQP